jgi:hypothetical protein
MGPLCLQLLLCHPRPNPLPNTFCALILASIVRHLMWAFHCGDHFNTGLKLTSAPLCGVLAQPLYLYYERSWRACLWGVVDYLAIIWNGYNSGWIGWGASIGTTGQCCRKFGGDGPINVAPKKTKLRALPTLLEQLHWCSVYGNFVTLAKLAIIHKRK